MSEENYRINSSMAESVDENNPEDMLNIVGRDSFFDDERFPSGSNLARRSSSAANENVL
jgi:hypothetical protein